MLALGCLISDNIGISHSLEEHGTSSLKANIRHPISDIIHQRAIFYFV